MATKDPELLAVLNRIANEQQRHNASTWARGGTVLMVLAFLCLLVYVAAQS